MVGERIAREGGPMRILLLCSAFTGLSRRAWLEQRAAAVTAVEEFDAGLTKARRRPRIAQGIR